MQLETALGSKGTIKVLGRWVIFSTARRQQGKKSAALAPAIVKSTVPSIALCLAKLTRDSVQLSYSSKNFVGQKGGSVRSTPSFAEMYGLRIAWNEPTFQQNENKLGTISGRI